MPRGGCGLPGGSHVSPGSTMPLPQRLCVAVGVGVLLGTSDADARTVAVAVGVLNGRAVPVGGAVEVLVGIKLGVAVGVLLGT